MTGYFIAVVGPSGVGKDTLMAAAAAQTDMVLARRVITRPSEVGGEDFEGVSEAEFNSRLAAGGEFALHWPAHGLRYAIPTEIDTVLAQGGRNVLANLSRAVLPQLAARFKHHRIVLLTAKPEVLAARLSARGRESKEEIARRLKRQIFRWNRVFCRWSSKTTALWIRPWPISSVPVSR